MKNQIDVKTFTFILFYFFGKKYTEIRDQIEVKTFFREHKLLEILDSAPNFEYPSLTSSLKIPN